MSVKALDKLRKSFDDCTTMAGTAGNEFETVWITKDAALKMANDIEAEIAERYMESPCDADGVPIRVGETVYGKYLKGHPGFTVRGFSFDLEHGQLSVRVGDAMWMSANLLSHVKPRTLEDVLRDVWKEALDYAKSDIWRNPDEVFAERAGEIRAMFGEVDDDD